jgi:large subunit ribosomal protein L25
MELAGNTAKVLLRDVQYHPFRQQVQHVDFQRVDANTRLHMKVPLHYKGAEESQAVKLEHCLVNPVVNDLDISCLPGDLPEFIEVDLSGLKKGMSLHLNDLKLPKGVKAVTHGKPNPVIVSVVVSAAEESAETAAEGAAAPAAEAKAAPAKGGKDAKPAAKAPAKK